MVTHSSTDFHLKNILFLGFPGGKESACDAGDLDSIPGSWKRAWQLTPIFLPGESRGQRRLVGYSPWGHKESDTTERLRSNT